MHKIVISLVLMFAATTALAENLRMDLRSTCDTIAGVSEFLDQNGEQKMMTGGAFFRRIDDVYAGGEVVVWANPENYNFTVTVEFEKDDVSCVVFVGEDLAPVISGEDI